MPPAPLFLARRLAPQFALPTGILGRLVGRFMNRSNRRMNAFTIDALSLGPSDHVMEIGFGGGLNLAPLMERVPGGRVIGVEPSETMIKSARRKHGAALDRGALRLDHGSVERLPAADASIDAVCSVNTIYFWKQPSAGAKEMHRVLRGGGRLAITLLPGDRMDLLGFPREVFRRWRPEEVESMLEDTGFTDVRTLRPEDPSIKWVCVAGKKR